jgi:hypothetical protein
MKLRKLRLAIGVILLIVLITPVLIMSRPLTVLDYSVVYHGNTPSLVATEHTYTPIVELAKGWAGAFPWSLQDTSFLLIYFGLYVLAFWLIRFKTKKERAKEELIWMSKAETA